ncbi:stemmadenine O-acetyltransferase-like [Tripterygium wilfordii]|nr:stemmadenine O-acetyltransferase-like [Tripterygium wilfordii]
MMKVSITRREIIKPSSPTPPNLKIFKLSLLDQVQVTSYAPVVFFYSSSNVHVVENMLLQRMQRLKISLSEALTQYYHFAGKFIDQTSIECNDQGAEFVEARVNCSLSDVLEQLDISQLEKLFSVDPRTLVTTEDFLVTVQANVFECGGMAIAICVTHKIVDAGSYYTFVEKWAAIARDSDDGVLPDLTIASSLFPPQDCILPTFDFPREKCVARRFVFSPSSIEALKTNCASTNVQRPTRTDVVVALLWKCLITTSKLLSGDSSNYMCTRAVNLRRRFSPPLPKHAVGNLLASLVTLMKVEDKNDLELQSIVALLRKRMQEFKFEQGQNIFGETNSEMMDLVSKAGAHYFYVTTSCGMSVYEADFGWGKPVWINVINLNMSNLVILNDMREGNGIEAIMYLTKEEMAVFERNHELLAFATLGHNIFEDTSRTSTSRL